MFVAIDEGYDVRKLSNQSAVVEFAKRNELRVDSSQHLNLFEDVVVTKKHVSHYAQNGYALYLRGDGDANWTHKVVLL